MIAGFTKTAGKNMSWFGWTSRSAASKSGWMIGITGGGPMYNCLFAHNLPNLRKAQFLRAQASLSRARGLGSCQQLHVAKPAITIGKYMELADGLIDPNEKMVFPAIIGQPTSVFLRW